MSSKATEQDDVNSANRYHYLALGREPGFLSSFCGDPATQASRLRCGARQAAGFSLLELVTDPRQITPAARLP